MLNEIGAVLRACQLQSVQSNLAMNEHTQLMRAHYTWSRATRIQFRSARAHKIEFEMKWAKRPTKYVCSNYNGVWEQWERGHGAGQSNRIKDEGWSVFWLASTGRTHAINCWMCACVSRCVCTGVLTGVRVCVCVRSIYLFGQSDLRATRIKIEFTSDSVYTA